MATVTDTPEQVWDEVLADKPTGIFLVARHAIPLIAARGGGTVINIASVQACASQQNIAASNASKSAILPLTRAMALDHAAHGLRVNASCAASIDTPMLRWAADIWKGEGTEAKTLDAWGRTDPIVRVGRVDEIGTIAAFLGSDDAALSRGPTSRSMAALWPGWASCCRGEQSHEHDAKRQPISRSRCAGTAYPVDHGFLRTGLHPTFWGRIRPSIREAR